MRGIAIVVFLVFLSAATMGTVRSNSRQTQLAMRARTSAVVTSIDDRLAAYDEVLYGVRSGFGVETDLDHRVFHDLVVNTRLRDRLPGVQVIGAAHLVGTDRLDEWQGAVDDSVRRSDLAYPDFHVHPPAEDSVVLPIDYMEPQEGNERAFGLDFFSEPNRRAAALRARDTGATSATAPITLVQETGTQRAILVMLALYRPGSQTATVEQRRLAFDGVVYAAFRMGDLMVGALGEVDPDSVTVIDVASNEVLYGDPDSEDLGSRDLGDVRVDGFDVSGRAWRVVIDDEQPVLSAVERSVPFATTLAGLLVAGLMIALVASMRSSRSRAIGLAAEMSGELRALTESASEAIISVDAQGRIVAWNAGATQIFGASVDQMLGAAVHDLVPARDGNAFDDAFAAVITGADIGPIARQTLITARRTDDSEFPAELSLSKWTTRDRVFVTGFVRDVTDRIEAEQRLTETTNMLLGVLGAATELSIIATDVDGTITVFNAGAEQMLGYESPDVVGNMTLPLFHDPVEVAGRAAELSMEPGFDVFTTIARHGDPETRQWSYVRSDGRRLPIELTVTPRYDASGNVCGFIGVALDITERLAANEQQQLLLDQERDMVVKLTELDRVKNDFVSTMSHELRTPLTSIIGYAELLADDPVVASADAQKAMVAMIDKNAQRLLLLVEDLLALSKIESGSLHASRAPCDVGRIIASSNQAIVPLASKRDITVTLGIGLLPLVNGDAPQLERVFSNLLTNAVKFSRPGGTIEVTALTSPDGTAVTVTIADHGIGIPEDERQHLFARFFRSRTAERNAIQGTGLGLSIVANIVHRHGGTIDVASIEDIGTTVTVDLPIDRAAMTDTCDPDVSDTEPSAQEAMA